MGHDIYSYVHILGGRDQSHCCQEAITQTKSCYSCNGPGIIGKQNGNSTATRLNIAQEEVGNEQQSQQSKTNQYISPQAKLQEWRIGDSKNSEASHATEKRQREREKVVVHAIFDQVVQYRPKKSDTLYIRKQTNASNMSSPTELPQSTCSCNHERK